MESKNTPIENQDRTPQNTANKGKSKEVAKVNIDEQTTQQKKEKINAIMEAKLKEKRTSGAEERVFGSLLIGTIPVIGGFWAATREFDALSKFSKSEVEEITAELQIEIHNLNREISDERLLVSDKLDEKNKTIQGLEKGTREIKQSSQQLQNQYLTEKAEWEENVTNAGRELNQTQKAKGELEREKGVLQAKIQTLTENMASLTANYNEVSRIKHQLETEIQETAQRINHNTLLPDPKDLDLRKWRGKCQELVNTNELQRGIITSKSIMVDDRDQQIVGLTTAASQLQDQKEIMEKELQELHTELANTKIDLESANRELERKSQQLETSDTWARQRESELTNLITKKNELEIIIEQGKIQLSSATNAARVQTERLEQAESKLHATEIENRAINRDITKLRAQTNNLTTEQNELRDDINKHFWFKASTTKEAVKRLIEKNQDLKKYEPTFIHKIGDYTGINLLVSKIGATFTVIGFGAVSSVVIPWLFKAYFAWQTAGLSLAAQRSRKHDDYDHEPLPARNQKPAPQIREATVIKEEPILNIQPEPVKVIEAPILNESKELEKTPQKPELKPTKKPRKNCKKKEK